MLALIDTTTAYDDTDRATIMPVIEAMGTAVAGADLTIDELDARVGELAGGWACERVYPAFATTWPRWRPALVEATYRGVLCFGPNRGRNVTYASVRRRVPGYARMDGSDALAAVVDKLGSRLGETETPLRQALHQIQLAFVEVSRSAAAPGSGD